MPTEQAFQYTHVEAGLVENVVIRRTDDTETSPSGWKYTLHLGTLEDLTLVRYYPLVDSIDTTPASA